MLAPMTKLPSLAVLLGGVVHVVEHTAHELLELAVDLLEGQDRCSAFWLISRPDTSTPPALAALPGIKATPFSWK